MPGKESKADYFRRRAAAEKAAADAAIDDHARAAHRDLSALYEQYAQGIAADPQRA